MATMNVKAAVKISFDVLLEDRGDHWAALIEQIGTYVYGDSEEAALKRADEMMEFTVSSFRKNSTFKQFREYLDSHSIQHSLIVRDVESDRPSPPLRYRREGVYPVVL